MLPATTTTTGSRTQLTVPSGGLELLFADQRSIKMALPATNPATGAATTVGDLVHHLADNVMDDTRKELFVVERAV